jgi:superfamily I DNA/RNA helicase
LLSPISPKPEADYVFSTIHRAKGLEWERVRVSGDFRSPGSKRAATC